MTELNPRFRAADPRYVVAQLRTMLERYRFDPDDPQNNTTWHRRVLLHSVLFEFLQLEGCPISLSYIYDQLEEESEDVDQLTGVEREDEVSCECKDAFRSEEQIGHSMDLCDDVPNGDAKYCVYVVSYPWGGWNYLVSWSFVTEIDGKLEAQVSWLPANSGILNGESKYDLLSCINAWSDSGMAKQSEIPGAIDDRPVIRTRDALDMCGLKSGARQQLTNYIKKMKLEFCEEHGYEYLDVIEKVSRKYK